MKRRDIIKYTSMATGAAISAPLMATLLSGCKTDAVVENIERLSFFGESEFEIVKTIVDLLLPKTDSPSASEVGVHTMIDHMNGNVHTEEEGASFKSKFDALLTYLNKANNDKGFLNLTQNEQIGLLANVEGVQSEVLKEAKDGFVSLKQQAIAYYLSSEQVAENFLNYLPVPGEYVGCISLEEAGGKKWAI